MPVLGQPAAADRDQHGGPREHTDRTAATPHQEVWLRTHSLPTAGAGVQGHAWPPTDTRAAAIETTAMGQATSAQICSTYPTHTHNVNAALVSDSKGQYDMASPWGAK